MTSQHAGDARPDAVNGGGAAAAGRSGPDEPPVLPAQTRDDTDAGWGERWRDEPDSDDERYLRERPPHWQ
jgi:hypothetical protein